MKKGQKVNYNEHLEKIKEATSGMLDDMGYLPLHIEGDYLYARRNREGSPLKNESLSDRAGDIRILLEEVKCDTVTIMA